MVEQQRKRVEDHMTKIVEEIDKSILRKMQRDMHRCAASCCENETYTIHKVHNCVENCSTSLHKAQQYVQGEFDRVQNRLQRCIMECNDNIKDKVGPNPTQTEVDRYGDEFEKCATKCVDSYCELLPSLEKTMKKVLSKNEFA
ncbi:protein FAM136A-like [Odontomachus brunneus]|uniref:protein FAM136A-like n=1 Tax=Odontomachus brunneus TaxID=486640 RepID=UPI0013F2727C|nr:protein FAM136A-like [Odontomachus brunneus]XP_032683244.1 protein FAM136A-like [Odontomachus brunneus]XP_032683245.1 protein FAM136A-like [Odontomachus brunneus]XP_032683246.1 protein FAM136A-like [Odontomachus brunneus]